jgi:phosphoglycolate phosphatase-like HAD superfamily hydrolase
VSRRPPYSGCLLDVDGTLIDSNDAHARSWIDVFHESEYDVTYAQVRALIGMGGDKLVRALTGLDVETGRGKELTAQRKQLFLRNYLPSLCATPGAHEFVRRMRSARGFELSPCAAAAGGQTMHLAAPWRSTTILPSSCASTTLHHWERGNLSPLGAS